MVKTLMVMMATSSPRFIQEPCEAPTNSPYCESCFREDEPEVCIGCDEEKIDNAIAKTL